MKHTFVADENILFCAAKGVDERNQQDHSSGLFLSYLLKNCHMLMVDESLKKKYQKIMGRLRIDDVREMLIPGLFNLLKQIVYNSEKLIIHDEEVPKEIDEDSIPRKDREIARLAYHFALPLVTLDANLRDGVNAHTGFQSKNIRAIRSADALAIVKET